MYSSPPNVIRIGQRDDFYYAMVPVLNRGFNHFKNRLNELIENYIQVWDDQNRNILSLLYQRRKARRYSEHGLDPQLREEARYKFIELDQLIPPELRSVTDFEDRENVAYNYNNDLIDMTNPLVRAYNGEIPLSPATFWEYARYHAPDYNHVLTFLENSQYRFVPGVPRKDQKHRYIITDTNGTRNIGNGEYRYRLSRPQPGMTVSEEYPWYSRDMDPLYSWFGWNKKQLQEAIANSGLVVDRDRPYYGRTTITQGIPLSALGITSNLSPGQEDSIYLPGIFSKNAYMARSYYVMLYSEIFKVPIPIDTLCPVRPSGDIDIQTQRTDPTIRRYLHRRFDREVDPELTHDELCIALRREIASHQNPQEMTSRRLGREAQEINQPFYEQAGNLWGPLPEYPEFRAEREQIRRQREAERQPRAYRPVRSACSEGNLMMSTKEQLLRYATELGLDLAPEMTKEQICDRIMRFLDVLEGRR